MITLTGTLFSTHTHALNTLIASLPLCTFLILTPEGLAGEIPGLVFSRALTVQAREARRYSNHQGGRRIEDQRATQFECQHSWKTLSLINCDAVLTCFPLIFVISFQRLMKFLLPFKKISLTIT
jgi:hypothetical protein